jgi:NAD(P)-dependent dehydrogenase (short-subunit alcohol dehydrogenase family)
VAVITGASQGIGEGLVAGFRRCGYAVVGTSLCIPPSDQPDYLTVQGDIAEPDTAQKVVKQALQRFGRIDSLINDAGIFIGKPFTDYTIDDYRAVTAVNLAGFFHITQRVIRQMVSQGSVCGTITKLSDRHVRTSVLEASTPSRVQSPQRLSLDFRTGAF